MREALGLVPKPPKVRSDVSDHSSVSDPGIETAFEEPAGTDSDFRDDVGERHYRYMCQQLDVIPSKMFIRQLQTDTASFRVMFTPPSRGNCYYGLDPRAIRPITECLEQNKFVKYLDLEDNWLVYDSACHLVTLFRINDTIEGLNLTGCRLGPQSAWKLSELLLATSRLRELLLSNNALGDAGVVALAEGICDNSSVHTLDLSRNHLGRGAAATLGAVLQENWALKTLDLSWNSLFDVQGFQKLVDGLIQNQGIETLNLTGNALGIDVLEILMDLLTQSTTLKTLDLSFNRLDDECMLELRQPIAQNEYLRVLKLGNNPISYSEAGALLTAIQKSPSNVLELLDMEGIWVNKKFKVRGKDPGCAAFLERDSGRGVQLRDPGARPHPAADEARLLRRHEPQEEEAEARLRNPVPLATFIELIQAENLKMTETLCTALGRKFFDKKRQVDLGKMTKAYMEYFPDTKLPPPPEPKVKGKKGKKDKQSGPVMLLGFLFFGLLMKIPWTRGRRTRQFSNF
ncbi:Uncharacterized protein GBIM_09298 [Gryllus bimaculatus]|nr:Uncharacterized protein GBIM_09298 [Gryllus bimaculatus]